MRLILALAVGVDQHSAVKRVTVPPRTLAGPRDAVHYGGDRKERREIYNVASCGFYLMNFTAAKNLTTKQGELRRASQERLPHCE